MILTHPENKSFIVFTSIFINQGQINIQMIIYQPQVLYLEMRTALCAKILIIPEPWQKMHCLAKSPNVMIKTPIKALQVEGA